MGDWCDRFLVVDASVPFRPGGRDWGLDVFGAAMELPACVGVVHESGSRRQEWDRLRRRDEVRPDFAVYSANNAALDQIVISARSHNEVWIIDHSTTTAEARTHSGGKRGHGGDFLYRWGNPQLYGAGTAADRTLFNQHDAQWIAKGSPGAGDLLVFNNGLDRPGGPIGSGPFVVAADATEDEPGDGREQIRKHDAILFGSAGHPDIPDHITLWGLRLAICQPFDQYANVRPTRILPGIVSPLRKVNGPELDWVIVRENSEGEYSGVGGRVHQGLPIEAATDVSMMTRAGVTRVIRFAFRLAQSRPRKLLTVVTKSNAQRYAMVMWDEVAAEVAKEFPDVTWDKMIVDAMTMRMVLKPETIDTIVATNLHADILSDLAAALAGSLGIAPTANLNPEREFPSMFEPIHGSAFDIMGKGIANPVGTFWSAVMMLEHLGEKKAADRLMKAIERVTADPDLHTPDLGGKANTRKVTDAVIGAIRAENA